MQRVHAHASATNLYLPKYCDSALMINPSYSMLKETMSISICRCVRTTDLRNLQQCCFKQMQEIRELQIDPNVYYDRGDLSVTAESP